MVTIVHIMLQILTLWTLLNVTIFWWSLWCYIKCQIDSTVNGWPEMYSELPSVLWDCWLGIRKSISPIRNWVMRSRSTYRSGARCKSFASGPADATATPLYLASLKSRLVQPFWHWLIQVVLEKRLLNRCLSVKRTLKHDPLFQKNKLAGCSRHDLPKIISRDCPDIFFLLLNRQCQSTDGNITY